MAFTKKEKPLTERFKIFFQPRQSDYLLWITIGLLTAGIRMAAGPWPVDDAYITFRYAQNLTNGFGLVYNPGQLVLGTSSPAFALLLGLFRSLLPVGIPWLALATSSIADGLTAILIHQIARRLEFPAWGALTCSLAWGFYPLSIRYALGGMETSLFTLVLLSSFAVYLSGRVYWTMGLLGFAILTRPDALAAVLVILIDQAYKNRRIPWRLISMFALVLLPWIVFATFQYGTPLPQSLLAKSRAIYREPPWTNMLQIIYQIGGLFLNSLKGIAAKGIILVPPGRWAIPLWTAAVVQFGIWLMGAYLVSSRKKQWTVFFLFPILFSGAYALLGLGGKVMAEWYLVPLSPFFILGIFTGWLYSIRQWFPYLRPSILLVGLLLVVVQLAGLNFKHNSGRSMFVPRIVWTEREELYRQAAAFLKPLLRPGDVVAASEIGALGFFCDCSILDTVGLVSPQAQTYYPLPPQMYATNYAIPPKLIKDTLPEYIVSLDIFTRNSLIKADWFTDRYRVIYQIETSVFGSKHLEIFARRTKADRI